MKRQLGPTRSLIPWIPGQAAKGSVNKEWGLIVNGSIPGEKVGAKVGDRLTENQVNILKMNDPAVSCRVSKPKGYSPAASCGE